MESYAKLFNSWVNKTAPYGAHGFVYYNDLEAVFSSDGSWPLAVRKNGKIYVNDTEHAAKSMHLYMLLEALAGVEYTTVSIKEIRRILKGLTVDRLGETE